MMLAFCLTGYIVISIYYANVIRTIRQDLDHINSVQACMFKCSQSLVSHIDVIKNDIMVFSSKNSTPVEKETAIENIAAHTDSLASMIVHIEKGILPGCPAFPESTVLATGGPGSALTISTKNALESLKNNIGFLQQHNIEQNLDRQDTHDLILQHTAEIENNLRVIEELSTKLLGAATLYIQQKIEHINHRAEWNSSIGILIMSLIMVILIIASYTWGAFLVGPLRIMARSLKSIKSSSVSSDGCPSIEKIPVTGQDEIGQVARAPNRLLEHMRNICHFRRTIESDENASDVYRRLGLVFKRQLGLKSFVIYETRSDSEKMLPVYIEPPDMEQELAELNITCEKCRAVRTGSFITSFKDEGICPVFSWPDALTHACIPMNVGGEILGVIQFIFPFVNNPEREEAFKNAVMEAKFYLMEALPVIKAKILAQTLTESATKDPMTGLFNRRYLEMNLGAIVARAKRAHTSLGILMCDLDYFKQVNDQYGHDTGDMVLMQLAKIIKGHARESDLAIRFGGEEFLILLVDCEPGFADKVAERIRAAVEQYVFRFPGSEFSKTISVGISEFPQDTDTIWEAIKFADVALYHAKERGRNRVKRFTAQMWTKKNF
jgi:diguanylate cyclase (GGDEF)-like protein